MAQRKSLNVNGKSVRISIDDPEMPLLYALRDNLALQGPRFGCGLGQCGACTVHIDGKAVRSCVMPLSSITPQQKVVTLEGLGSPQRPHPVQKAFIDEQAAQCGYCINGMIMESVALLATNRSRAIPTSRRRSPTISVAAARMCASSPPSSARPAPREGEGTMNFHCLSPRRAQGWRRPRRQLLACSASVMRSRRAAAKPVTLTEVDSFLAIDASGQVTVYSGKVDLGTGITTALRQIVAEELDVPFSRDRARPGRHQLTPDQGKTWGSLTIQVGGMQLRNAAATARGALLEEAAKRLNAKPEDLKVADGVVERRRQARHLWRSSIGGKSFALKLDPAKPAQPKDPKDHTFVGKSIPRVDIPDKITGRFTYMHDFRVPGMLHGRVVRPPAIGATLQSVDESSVKDIPGLVKVVREGNFLGVVARSEWGAITGGKQAQGHVVEMGGPARAGQALRARARNQGRSRTRSPATSATPRPRCGRRRAQACSDLRLCDPHPRLDRAVLCGRRIQGRQAHLVVGLAGDARSAQAARRDAWPVGG